MQTERGGQPRVERKDAVVLDLTAGSVPKQLIVFAFPLFLSNALQAVYSIVDMIVVGQFVGSAGLSAVSIGSDVLNFLMYFSIGFSTAGQVIVSQYIGARRKADAAALIGTMISFFLILSVAETLVCLAACPAILDAMSTPSEALPHAMPYTLICLGGVVFTYEYNAICAVLRGMGDSKHPFLFVLVATVVNIVLDLVFVAGLGMGTAGAALATVIGQFTSFLCAALFLYRNSSQLGLAMRPRSFRMDGRQLAALLELGVPMALQSASISFSKLFVNSWLNGYGTDVSAVTGVGVRLTHLCYLFNQAIGSAASSMIGQAIGARRLDRIPRILRVSYVVTAPVIIVLGAAVLAFPGAIFGLFVNDEQTLLVAYQYIPVFLIELAAGETRCPMNALINGSGCVSLNIAVAILDGVVARIGFSLLFGLVLGMGYTGFWVGGALAGFVPFFLGIAYLVSGQWKHRAVIGASRKDAAT